MLNKNFWKINYIQFQNWLLKMYVQKFVEKIKDSDEIDKH